MKRFSIREALGAGWRSYATRPWYLLGLALAVMVLFIFAVGDAGFTALSYIVFGGYIALIIKHFHGEPVVFDDLFNLDSRWVSFAFLGIIKSLLLMLAFLCFVIPGIYLSIRWMFADFYVIHDGMRPLEALRASSELTKGQWWHLFLYSLVVGLLVIVGLFVFVIGAVAVAVVALIATIKIFEDLKQSQFATPEPSLDPVPEPTA